MCLVLGIFFLYHVDLCDILSERVRTKQRLQEASLDAPPLKGVFWSCFHVYRRGRDTRLATRDTTVNANPKNMNERLPHI